jgi:hypothetical protein
MRFLLPTNGERPMRTRILLAMALVLALVVVPAATGATKKKRDLQATVHMAVIGPNGQSGSQFAGEFVGRPLGKAALLFQNTVTGTTSNGKGVLYTKHGTIRATATNEVQPQPDGSAKLPGTFKITGGTGRYRGATGGGTFDGVVPANSTIFEVTFKGKIRY